MLTQTVDALPKHSCFSCGKCNFFYFQVVCSSSGLLAKEVLHSLLVCVVTILPYHLYIHIRIHTYILVLGGGGGLMGFTTIFVMMIL